MNLVEDRSVPKDSRIDKSLRRRAGVFAGAFALASLWSSAALADQFVVVDSTWEHTPEMPDSHYRVLPLPGIPTDWRNPIDYASGSAHVRLEVFTKPTDTPTKFQVCFEATPTYACTAQSPTYTTVGVVEWDTAFTDFWSPPGTTVDWTQGTVKIALILKDTQNGKPSADNVGAAEAALYTPTQVRMVVTIVAPGSTYEPPPPPDAGVPVDPDAGTGQGGMGGMGAASGTGTGAGGDPQDAGVEADAGTLPSDTVDNDSGCNLAPERGSAGAVGWLALSVAAAGLARLRRRSQRR